MGPSRRLGRSQATRRRAQPHVCDYPFPRPLSERLLERVTDESPLQDLFGDSGNRRYKATVDGPVRFLEGRRSSGDPQAVRLLPVD